MKTYGVDIYSEWTLAILPCQHVTDNELEPLDQVRLVLDRSGAQRASLNTQPLGEDGGQVQGGHVCALIRGTPGFSSVQQKTAVYG
jgi:hypothetical protein